MGKDERSHYTYVYIYQTGHRVKALAAAAAPYNYAAGEYNTHTRLADATYTGPT